MKGKQKRKKPETIHHATRVRRWAERLALGLTPKEKLWFATVGKQIEIAATINAIAKVHTYARFQLARLRPISETVFSSEDTSAGWLLGVGLIALIVALIAFIAAVIAWMVAALRK